MSIVRNKRYPAIFPSNTSLKRSMSAHSSFHRHNSNWRRRRFKLVGNFYLHTFSQNFHGSVGIQSLFWGLKHEFHNCWPAHVFQTGQDLYLNFVVTTPEDVDLIGTIDAQQPMEGANATQSTSNFKIWSYGPIKYNTVDIHGDFQIQVTFYWMFSAGAHLYVSQVLRCQLSKLMLF